VNVFDVLGDPVRRRILELLQGKELSSGAIVEVIGKEFGITQAAVSQQLRVLREAEFALVTPQGARRIYRIGPAAFREVDAWLEGFRNEWVGRLDDLAEEIKRGKEEAKVLEKRSEVA